MNCAAWEERILQHLEGEPDAEAAEHLRDCPACAALAAELALDAQRLRMPPPEAAAVDYDALRAAARRGARQRRLRRKVLAVLAAAAAVLLASRLAVHRDLPQMAHLAPVAPPAQVARVVPPTAPSAAPSVLRRPARHRRRKPETDLDRQFADYLRSVAESQRPAPPRDTDSPPVVRIATSNPNVIIWLQEPKGNDHE